MSYIDASEMTDREFYRLNGTLTESRIDRVLDLLDSTPDLENVVTKIEEGMTQFPAEDFLEGIKTRLHELSKKVRGQNKDELKGIIEALDDLAQTTFYAADYGRKELHDALAEMGETSQKKS